MGTGIAEAQFQMTFSEVCSQVLATSDGTTRTKKLKQVSVISDGCRKNPGQGIVVQDKSNNSVFCMEEDICGFWMSMSDEINVHQGVVIS